MKYTITPKPRTAEMTRRIIAAVEAVRATDAAVLLEARERIPDHLRHLTFFSREDWWVWVTAGTAPCETCQRYSGMIFSGTRIRRFFKYLEVTDANTIGGPSAADRGLAHPNCYCYLRRVTPVETPKTPAPRSLYATKKR
jgi:hypothetical protein